MSDIIRATIRQRGQITLPAKVRRELGLGEGDSVTIESVDGRVVLTPSRRRALDALAAIQAAFQKSRISERELLAGGKRIRRELVKKRYAGSKRS